ncbi:PRM1A protein, partial [Brachypteracias leptosomus]|nr:PRM1A protein [Brachypteracias leptosomus]
MELGNVSQPVYNPGLEAPRSSTPGLVEMVHGFLRLVQPNALPVGGCIVAGGWQWGRGAARSCRVPVLVYELGFLVCVAIGLLFIILVPLVGCCFCCCRC